jgi:hypothetical protein
VVAQVCAYGGIGRHAGFRYQCESVGVRVPLGVPLKSMKQERNAYRHGLRIERSVLVIVNPAHAPVAQLVEQWFEEPRVSGSNPFGSTSFGSVKLVALAARL